MGWSWAVPLAQEAHLFCEQEFLKRSEVEELREDSPFPQVGPSCFGSFIDDEGLFGLDAEATDALFNRGCVFLIEPPFLRKHRNEKNVLKWTGE